MLELAKTLFWGDADVNWHDKARLGRATLHKAPNVLVVQLLLDCHGAD